LTKAKVSMIRHRSRCVRYLVPLLVGALALGACGGGDDDDEAADTDKTTTTREATTTTTVVPVIAPLTGLVEPTGESLNRGPLWVKIDNNQQTKRPPQAGLDVADVVYEEPIERVATRFLALFHSTLPERIGPVRSTRFLDPGIVWHVGGLYVFSGGTPPKVAAIRESPVQTVDENGLQNSDARQRDSNFSAPHNLFFSPATLLAWDEIADQTPPEPLFSFLGGGATFAGDAVSVVEIPSYSKARYTWDATAGGWKREAQLYTGRGVEAHIAESGAQITPTNIIIQNIGSIRDNTDDKSLVTGEGDAWVCSQGKCTNGTWSRSDLDANTTFTDANGTEIELTPGTTWVHFIESGAPTMTP